MNVELLAMIGAVLVASVVGSLHCAGMCGAFVAMAVGLDREASKARLIAAYNGGRLVTYTLIGVLAGWLGGAFDSGAELVGLQRGAAALAAATMIVIGTAAFLKALGVRLPRVRGPKAVQGAFVHVARVSVRFSPAKRAGAIGLATGLLPCGWLYAFALLAAGTAHPVAGGLVMAAFWMGTLPMLVSLGAGVRLIAGSVGRAAP
ncbi:MAG: sulfite exporter TauE/SafE family protein, partial [Planctomycetota bacterium]